MTIRHVATIAIKDRAIQIHNFGGNLRVKLLYWGTGNQRSPAYPGILLDLLRVSGAVGEKEVHRLLRRDKDTDTILRKLVAGEKMRRLLEKQGQVPVLLPSGKERLFGMLFEKQEWLYRGRLYQANQPYMPEEVKLLVWEKTEKERRRFERLRKQMEAGGAIDEARRERIPEDVRTFVWRRDGGRCVTCGNSDNLEFDHIIPVSRGGSSTSKNVQLLCAECNRKKRDHI